MLLVNKGKSGFTSNTLFMPKQDLLMVCIQPFIQGHALIQMIGHLVEIDIDMFLPNTMDSLNKNAYYPKLYATGF